MTTQTRSPTPRPASDDPTDPPEALPPIHLPEAMLAYRCNLHGCCCAEWHIHFSGDDLLRLAELLPEEEIPAAIGDGLICILDTEQQRLDHFELQLKGQERLCRFLQPDGTCSIQNRFGLDALPSICVDYPVVPWRLAGRVELGFSSTCPAVLDALCASRGPLRIATTTELDPMFRRRLERTTDIGRLLLGGVPLEGNQVFKLRETILQALEAVERPALEQLQAISYGFAFVLNAGELGAFELRYDLPPLPFVRFFHHALCSHAGLWLARHASRYSRFLVSPEMIALVADEARLTAALDGWQAGLARFVEPAEEELRPYFNRFLALRFFNCVARFEGEAVLSFGRVAHLFATALRYASAFCLLRQRPLDRPTLQTALGAASYVYHSERLLPQTAVWFVPDHFLTDAPPPRQMSGTDW